MATTTTLVPMRLSQEDRRALRTALNDAAYASVLAQGVSETAQAAAPRRETVPDVTLDPQWVLALTLLRARSDLERACERLRSILEDRVPRP